MHFQQTVAAFNPYQIGNAAGTAILERIHDNSIENRTFIFPPTLIQGNSVSKLI